MKSDQRKKEALSKEKSKDQGDASLAVGFGAISI